MYQEGKEQELIRVPFTCYHCGKPVHWDDNDKRASEFGSFVADDGTFECPDKDGEGRTWLHQG